MCYLEQGVDTIFGGDKNFRRESTYRKNLPKEGSKATGPEDVKQSQGLGGWVVEQERWPKAGE